MEPVRVRVVLAAPTWSLNGPNVFSARLAGGLLKKGWDARIVLTRPDWADAKPMPIPEDVPIDGLSLRARFMPVRERWAAMMTYLNRLAPCVYLPNHDFTHSCISAVLPRKVKICGILHSDDEQHYDHAARLGRYWDAIVAVSAGIAREVQTRLPDCAPRLEEIPYGVPVLGRLLRTGRSETERLRLIYAGRLEQQQKRVLDLPAVLSAVRNLGVPAELTICGAGPEEQALRRECAGLPVHFTGTLGGEQLLSLYERHDVFLLTSAYEGLSIGMLEAMGRGCVPVVSQVRSGADQVVEQGANGFLAPVGAIGEFAHRLRSLHTETGLLDAMSTRAVETIANRYDLATMVDRYAALFERLGRTDFARPAGRIRTPPELPWQELLPGFSQTAGHHVRNWFKRR